MNARDPRYRSHATDPRTLDAAQAAPPREPADTGALARRLGRMLARPGLTAYAVTRIGHVDTAFGIFDALLRSGAPVPAYWILDDGSAAHTLDSVTCAYDALSEALRETGGVSACAAALRAARREWEQLDSALCDGSPLPEPWSGAQH